MNSTLARVAMASFGVAALCLIAGYSMAGSDWHRHDWHWRHGRYWLSGWGACPETPPASAGQPDTITLPWQNIGTLRVGISAQVEYQPGEPAQAVITGDPSIIAHIRLANGSLTWDEDDCFTSDRPIHVRLQGGPVAEWKLSGSGNLVLNAVAQPTLSVDLSGSGAISANGKVDRLNLQISGSADADLSRLAASSASVRVSGSGQAEISPSTEADLRISGSGDIKVHRNPTIRSHVSGSGSVEQVP
jgi:hypothetical protein